MEVRDGNVWICKRVPGPLSSSFTILPSKGRLCFISLWDKALEFQRFPLRTAKIPLLKNPAFNHLTGSTSKLGIKEEPSDLSAQCDEVLDMFSSANDFCSSTELFDFGLDSDLSEEPDFLGYDTCPYFTPPPSPPQQGQQVYSGKNEFNYLKQLIMPDTKVDQAFKAGVQQESWLPEEDCGYLPARVKTEVPDVQQQNWEPELSNVSPVVEKKSSKLSSDAAKLKAPRRGYSSSKSKKSFSDKESDEYRLKRQRNNIAVRKSRFKSKMKTVETEQKVQELADENDRLQNKVEYLTKELNVLRNLIANSNLMK